MPKLKSHQGTRKRVRVTKNGKLVHRHAFRSHFLSKKRASRKRLFTKMHQIKVSDVKNIKKLLGKTS